MGKSKAAGAGAGAGAAGKRHGAGKKKKMRKTTRPSSAKRKGAVVKKVKKVSAPVAEPKPLAQQGPNKGERKESRDEVAVKAKVLWEKLRIRDGSSSEKQEGLVAQLQTMLDGRLLEMSVRHDTSRIIQWMLACGSTEQQARLKSELMPSFVTLAMDKYARHLAMKMVRLAKKTERDLIFKAFEGHVMSLVRSAHGADVLDFAYQTVATAQQKTDLTTEFMHGKETALLSALRMKQCKVKTFNDMLDQAGETFRPALLSSAGEIIKALSGKEASLRMALVHRACREYVGVLDEGSDELDEIAQLFGPSALSFVHTSDGVVFVCKVMCALKTEASFLEVLEPIRGNALKIASDEYGHMFIMCLLGRVSDANLLWDNVFAEILNVGEEEMRDILCHKHARMVFLHLLAPMSTRYFHPQAYSFLTEVQTVCAKESLMERIGPPLSLAVEGDLSKLLADPNGAPVATEHILLSKSATVLKKVVRALEEASTDESPLLSSSVGVRTVRWLVSLTAAQTPSLGELVSAKSGLVKALGAAEGGCRVLMSILKTERLRSEVADALEGVDMANAELANAVAEMRSTRERPSELKKRRRRG